MSRLSDKLSKNEKVFTAEITPPKGAGIKKLVQHAELLKPLVDAINITDCQRALVKMSSLAACRVLEDHGAESVFQLTCRDRNSIAMQSDLMGATALGIKNLLCLTGDPVKVGDSPQSKSVFEFESTKLLELVAKLQSGRDGNGHKMNAATKLYVGAVVNPTIQSNQLDRMKKKVDNGAKFFQTQANYDNDDCGDFLVRARELNSKVLTGILILHDYESAQFIHANIPGVRMPESVLEHFKQVQGASEEEAFQLGVDFAVDTMLKLQDVCDGFHVMSIRQEPLIAKVLEEYRAKRNAS